MASGEAGETVGFYAREGLCLILYLVYDLRREWQDFQHCYLKKKGCDSVNKVGWYFQQFLTLAFALTSYCKGYYLTWDSDTLPISELHFFQDGQPLFTMKKEYHRPYFNTLQRLIGLDKTSSKSFIAEHMIFKPEFVCEII